MLYINVMEINYNNIWGIEIYTKHLQPSFYEHPCFQQPEKTYKFLFKINIFFLKFQYEIRIYLQSC